MPSKTALMTIGMTLAVIAVINNVSQLAPVKKVLLGDSSWF